MVQDDRNRSMSGTQPPLSWHVNSLIHEKSPYLLQHAHNPVDWYPWGDEAFREALVKDKPVFLSIGYATCHWCHVMAHESFEDEVVARLLNNAFICIKVDREERPDIDSVYMAVCQMMTGSGGWPLNIVMTPDKIPFFAATFIPREGRFGMMGLLDLVPKISVLWKERRSDVVRSAQEIKNALMAASPPNGSRELDEQVLTSAYGELLLRFDSEFGGFGHAPKFPTPHTLMFLLRYWNRTKNPRALEMVTKTLDEIRRGGLYDHIGYGIHRYSTDVQWRVPHFEKMLYDQALLAMAYTEAYLVTHEPDYQAAAEEILAYVLRDLTSPEGAFYSAEDADSEGKEGAFYLWTPEQLRQALGRENAALAQTIFNVTADGNFSDTRNDSGVNILYLTTPLDEIAKKHSMTLEKILEQYKKIRSTLFSVRRQRTRPGRDDKVLSDWNGLAIAAFSKAAQAFNRPDYADTAARATGFILTSMNCHQGGLCHRYRDGETAIMAFAEDYACMVWGLIELYEATFDAHYLSSAVELNRYLITHFWDRTIGGFFTVSDISEQLLVRRKEIYDGALPSGNSIAFLNLVRLARLTGNPDLEKLAAKLCEYFSMTVQESAASYTLFLCALDHSLGPSHELVIAGTKGGPDTQAMVNAYRSRFLPSAVLILKPDDGSESIVDMAPYVRQYCAVNGQATAYVCSNQVCAVPTTDPEKLLELLPEG